jgi:N-acetylmuramoyl-L-alanine amidase
VRSQVSGGIVRVFIDTDGTAAYRDFTLSGPSRIVIDLSAVKNGVGYRTIPVAAGAVEKVRVGEPEAGTTRIVIDLSSQSGYRVARVGSSLVVSVGENRVAVKSDR